LQARTLPPLIQRIPNRTLCQIEKILSNPHRSIGCASIFKKYFDGPTRCFSLFKFNFLPGSRLLGGSIAPKSHERFAS
jgi:hypothetical protein